MGFYRLVLEGVGAHGCSREKGHGETVIGCEQRSCPDCKARELVRQLKRSGEQLKRAEIIHWPADLTGGKPEDEVHDNLLSGVRTGSFPERERYLSQGG